MKENIEKNIPLVSIIIPLYVISERFFRDLKKFQKLKFTNYEILIVSDREVDISGYKKTRLILTKVGKSGPAEKRDLALKYAKGKVCAFIDDDAYPDPDWLSNVLKNFNNKEIVAVGGPGVTPPEDKYWEQITGLIYESFFCSGATLHRFIPMSERYVEDYPAYNLFVRTKVLKEIGGYKNNFYGGEDTFLCLNLIEKGKIFYDPRSLVYHHRRKLFFDLLKQIANVGLHRGFFAKKFPKTSRKWYYFLPSLLSFGLFFGIIISLKFFYIAPFFIGLIIFFILLGALSVADRTKFYNALLVGVGIILVHIAYGTSFARGILIDNLKR